ncbi:hypothetical protein GQF01_17975 [Paenibacillus sp. 5J-6]|uniref:Uncharacterized protein n=1 Tax=Paenibacillus silvestris TaxID=2606219 RepID=A0A6L8V111_9BACL|nr:hypothetical protein [Paenibacillus silvestris]MZQ84005.1 hypothetical protein [Paenibacillus silvestris]
MKLFFAFFKKKLIQDMLDPKKLILLVIVFLTTFITFNTSPAGLSKGTIVSIYIIVLMLFYTLTAWIKYKKSRKQK